MCYGTQLINIRSFAQNLAHNFLFDRLGRAPAYAARCSFCGPACSGGPLSPYHSQMADMDILTSVVRDVRGVMMAAAEDSAEPSITAILKEVTKDPEFVGVKLTQAQVSHATPSLPRAYPRSRNALAATDQAVCARTQEAGSSRASR